MNILHVIPGDLWAGAEAQVYYTVKELNTLSPHKVRVILFSRGELYKRLLAANVEVTLLDESRLGNVSICNGIKQQLIVGDVHIAHVHEYKSHMLTALARLTAGKKDCALFRTLHGQNVPSSFKSYLVLGGQKFFLRYMTDHLIAVSGQLEKRLSRQSTRADVHLIYNAVDRRALLSSAEVAETRRSYGLAAKQFWIGTAARLEVVKNLQMLIEAAGYLRDRHPELSFHISIFGEGSLRDVLKSQILQHGLIEHVFLEGHNNDIMPALQSLDVFTLTSLHEGLPMSLLEAMSVGTIPVCTAVGGMKEVISHGEDGFLVAPADAGELADTFAYINSEGTKLNPVRVKAREKIKQSFSVKQNCQKLFSLYEESYRAIMISRDDE